MTTDAPLSSSRVFRWLWPAIAILAACLAIIAAWYLAIPRHEICAAIYPSPPGCGDHRVPAATLWTVVLALTALASIVSAAMRRIPSAVTIAASALTAVLALVGAIAVLNA